jgi:dTDP-4-dehydrorhamnose reductase
MHTRRILLIGKNGQVGWELRRTLAPLGEVVAVDVPEIDLRNDAGIRNWIETAHPNVVVNAAAYTAVDRAESESDLAMRINGHAPGVLADECKKRHALFVHYSTDYVFEGTKADPYVETDAPNPLGAYGRSKLMGDQAIQQVDGDHVIFRLCWVYGARGHNFLRTILRLARERETLRVVRDQHGSPTWSRWIAEATSLALQQVLAALDRTVFKGVYHLSAGGATSWHGFAEAIVGQMRPEGKRCQVVAPIATAQYPTAARRPSYSVLSNDKLRRTFGLVLPPWEEGLKLVFEEMSA